MGIKAIETIYSGYRFRSRLEARWAVFFDALGVVYEYEKEGYDLGEAGWYLPDFWLPEFKLWVEIKPAAFIGNKTNEEHKKARALRNGLGYPVMLCYGLPKQFWGYLYIAEIGESSGGLRESWAQFAFDGSMVHPLILVLHDQRPRSFKTADLNETLPRFVNEFHLAQMQGVSVEEVDLSEAWGTSAQTSKTPRWWGDSPSWDAATKARQARFEHGE